MTVGSNRKIWVQLSGGMMVIAFCALGNSFVAGETVEKPASVSMPTVSPGEKMREPAAPSPGQSPTSLSSGADSGMPGLGPAEQNSLPLLPAVPGEYSYNASGRREPFAAIVKDGRLPGEENHNLPPLQRISLTELNLIGIIWGGFGYSAMVQAPDGKGYTVRQGTRIGPNNGTVNSITENAVIVHERFMDVYGNQQVREYVKLLHAKEGSE